MSKPEWDGREVELVLVTKIRYKLNSEDYEGADTFEQAVAIDVSNLRNDPVGVLNMETLFDDGHVEYGVSWREIDA